MYICCCCWLVVGGWLVLIIPPLFLWVAESDKEHSSHARTQNATTAIIIIITIVITHWTSFRAGLCALCAMPCQRKKWWPRIMWNMPRKWMGRYVIKVNRKYSGLVSQKRLILPQWTQALWDENVVRWSAYLDELWTPHSMNLYCPALFPSHAMGLLNCVATQPCSIGATL